MNKKLNTFIIDLDGTLINSGPDLIDSLNFVLKKHNIQIVEKEVIGSLVGGGAKAMLEKAFKYLDIKIDENNLSIMIKDFIEFYYDNCCKKSFLYPEVLNTLEFLYKKKIKLGLCTNKRQFLTEKILKELNIDIFFDYVIGSQKGIKLKPNSEMLEMTLSNLNSNPEESVMVGDSSNDIIPGKKIGMKTVFVTYGFGKICNAKPDFIKNNFNEILEIL